MFLVLVSLCGSYFICNWALRPSLLGPLCFTDTLLFFFHSSPGPASSRFPHITLHAFYSELSTAVLVCQMNLAFCGWIANDTFFWFSLIHAYTLNSPTVVHSGIRSRARHTRMRCTLWILANNTHTYTVHHFSPQYNYVSSEQASVYGIPHLDTFSGHLCE
jgi:hypothetical protein